MSNSDEQRFELLWKGRQSGPFSLAVIREKLSAGEISRMHQIQFDGRWMVLDEFLEKHAGTDPLAPRQAALAKRRERLRGTFESGLSVGRPPVDDSGGEAPRSPLSHLLPRPPHPAQEEEISLPESEPIDAIASPSRTSSLAIVSLVMALCNFVPYLNFVTWIVALFCGHMALSRMKRDPELGGRGMAIAGLLITYFLLVMGLTLAVLLLSHNQRLN
ncbi:MAG: hypothetical protein JWL59_3355 [Chthoniobacteraceae bacterium]|nr:hypothetical protein [Chthoniobacteraceae bacterium]